MLYVDSLRKGFPACQESRAVLPVWAPQAAEQTFVLCYTGPSSAISQLLEEKQGFAFIKYYI